MRVRFKSLEIDSGQACLEITIQNGLFNRGRDSSHELSVVEVGDRGHTVVHPESTSGAKYLFKLGLLRGGNLAAFTHGTYRFYIDGSDEPLKVDKLDPIEYTGDSYRNVFSRGEDGALELTIEQVWGEGESTPEMRKENARSAYGEFRELPLDEDMVFFESMSTHDFNDSPRAIYEELAQRGGRWKLVWGLENDKTDIGPNGTVVRYDSFEYWRSLATAKYIVSNIHQYRLVKRPGQVVVNTMHGIPLKRMGLVSTKDEKKLRRMRKLYEQVWDVFVSPCDYMSDILRGESFNYRGEILEVGYPRNDAMINKAADKQLRESIRAKLGVPDGKKLILYAPTYRNKDRVHVLLDFKEMREALSAQYCLAFRAHYKIRDFIDPAIYNDFVLDGNVVEDANELLVATDLLITDYSSIMFDFSILRRPVILMIPDWERYSSTRGTYFDPNVEYPALVAVKTKDVIEKVKHPELMQETLEAFARRFSQYETGHASRDVVDALWGAQQQ